MRKNMSQNVLALNGVSRVAQLTAWLIVIACVQTLCVRLPFKAQTLLCGSPAQERCWPTTCAHSLAMNTRHNNPIVSQRTFPLAGYEWHNNPIVSQKEPAIGKITHHHSYTMCSYINFRVLINLDKFECRLHCTFKLI